MHRESGDDDDDDDDELVRERWDDSDRDSSSTGWRSSLGSSFLRRGDAWWKERLLTFKEECSIKTDEQSNFEMLDWLFQRCYYMSAQIYCHKNRFNITLYYEFVSGNMSTSFGWGKGGNVTSAGWQVTLCDPIWHVSSRSGDGRLACKLL